MPCALSFRGPEGRAVFSPRMINLGKVQLRLHRLNIHSLLHYLCWIPSQFFGFSLVRGTFQAQMPIDSCSAGVNPQLFSTHLITGVDYQLSNPVFYAFVPQCRLPVREAAFAHGVLPNILYRIPFIRARIHCSPALGVILVDDFIRWASGAFTELGRTTYAPPIDSRITPSSA